MLIAIKNYFCRLSYVLAYFMRSVGLSACMKVFKVVLKFNFCLFSFLKKVQVHNFTYPHFHPKPYQMFINLLNFLLCLPITICRYGTKSRLIFCIESLSMRIFVQHKWKIYSIFTDNINISFQRKKKILIHTKFNIAKHAA